MSYQQDIALNGLADFDLPEVESGTKGKRTVHVGGPVCTACEG